MFEIAVEVAARDRTSGHPLWYLLIVAAGAVGVLVVIKANEYRARPRPARDPRRRSVPTWPILVLALLSASAAAIHSAVSAEHFDEAFVYGAFFLVASTGQAGWAALIVYRPKRSLLVVGAVANAATIMLWALTRTVGLPVGPQPWRAEAVGTFDLISTLLELAIVLGALTLVARRAPLAPPDLCSSGRATPAANHPARPIAGVVSLAHDGRPVHPDRVDARGMHAGRFVGRDIVDHRGVEEHEVRPRVLFDHAAAGNAELRGRHAGHAMSRLFE